MRTAAPLLGDAGPLVEVSAEDQYGVAKTLSVK
jgi:hypothetical protein